jgi:hypothetical protein
MIKDYLLSIISKISPIFTVPLFILILLSLIFLFYINRKTLFEYFKNIEIKTWIFLGLIFLFGTLLRLFLVSKSHIMYMDEFYYMQGAKEILETGQINTGHLRVWSFILSLAFGIFGLNNYVAIYAGIFFGCLTILAVFILIYVLTKNETSALFCSLIFSLIGYHIRWSATAKTNVTSFFFLIITTSAFFIYYQKKSLKLLWLSLILLLFTMQIREENYLLPIIFFVAQFIYFKKKSFEIKRILPWLILLLSLISFDVILNKIGLDFLSKESAGVFTGPDISVNNFLYNAPRFGIHIFDNTFYPWIFIFLFLIGMFFAFRNNRKEFSIFLIWSVSFFILFFSAWFQTMGGGSDLFLKSRYYLLFLPAQLFFIAISLDKIIVFFKSKFFKKRKNLMYVMITVILILCSIPYLIEASQKYNSSDRVLFTDLVEQFEEDIPDKCVILLQDEVYLQATTELNTYNIDRFNSTDSEKIFNQYDCVLLFIEKACQLENNNFCLDILQQYNYSVYKKYYYEDYDMNLYQIFP